MVSENAEPRPKSKRGPGGTECGGLFHFVGGNPEGRLP